MSRLLTTLAMFLALGFVVGTSYAQKLAPEDLSNSSYALDANGTLYAWGFNGWGQLGNGNTTDQYIPVVVSFPGGVTITAIAAGANHALGIGSDGNLYTWGLNGYGQLGDGTTTQRKMPVAVSLTCKAIAAGQSHSLAIGTDGKLYTWGCNQRGQLGDGTTNDSHAPVMRTSATWTAIAAGQNHSSGIDNNGNLYTWGDNMYGQLGNGTNGPTSYSYTPIPVTNPTGVTSWTAIATGGNYYNLAIGNNGKIYAWGLNGNGQLGDNSTTNRNTPVAVVGLPNGVTWTAIATGTSHSLALGSDGNIYAWGSNNHGQLGNNSTSLYPDSTPVLVTMPTGVTSWKAIAAGNSHSLAIGNNNYAYAWGYNGYGELGNGGVQADSIPARVLGVGGIGDLALPVEVTGFYAVSKADCAVLTWKTQSEVDMAGFNIYREDPGSSSFNLIASYETDDNLKSPGTSTSARTYAFIDRKVQARNTYMYKLQSVATNSVTKDYDPISVRVGVPESYGLSQNYPNPFNPVTTISYQLQKASHVTMAVYDMLGQKVAVLVDEDKDAGSYEAVFDASKLSNGAYYYKLQAGTFTEIKKLTVLK